MPLGNGACRVATAATGTSSWTIAVSALAILIVTLVLVSGQQSDVGIRQGVRSKVAFLPSSTFATNLAHVGNVVTKTRPERLLSGGLMEVMIGRSWPEPAPRLCAPALRPLLAFGVRLMIDSQ